ncbi:MAG: alanine racemase [Lachnospiraceae bacterium]|nr:alanine racemase [Lachnospiraceae bacterium]
MKYYNIQANVDLDAIRHNILEMRKHIRPQTKLLAVIKADGYGHGAVAVAKALNDLADYYAVARLGEATELRRYGIIKPILILGYSAPEEYQELIEQDITITVFRLEDARRLSEAAGKLGKTAKIHIKIDTGMSRIGYMCDLEAVEEIKQIAKLPNLNMEGIFTHFAKADEANKDAFHGQLLRFRSMLDALEREGITFAIRHAANSAAIMEEGDLGLDMVRSGISTYGLYPSDEVDPSSADLIPAMSLTSKISHIKTLAKGIGIGYGWTYTTEKETVVATIPVGYADGYKRALSNQGRVLIRGQYAKILGRVCMDQIMVDVTEIPDAAVGDTVTLFGQDGEASIPVEEIANMSESFNYEFVCGIASRVPRIYTMNGKYVGELNYLEQTPVTLKLD